MKKIKEGLNVKLIHNNELIQGTVRTTFEGLDTVIVETQNEELIKTTIDLLIVDQSKHEQQFESNNEIEKPISYDEFKKAIVDQITMSNLCLKYGVSPFLYFDHAQIGLALGAKMAAELFEKMDSTITITKSKLYETIDQVITLDLFSDECLPEDFSMKQHLMFTSIIKEAIDELFDEND